MSVVATVAKGGRGLAKGQFVDVFFTVIMVDSCKGYSSSFFDVLLICIVSAALQMMVDHDKKQQENKTFSQRLRSTQTESRPWT